MKESSTHNSGNDFSKQLEEKYQNLTFDFGVSDENGNKPTLKAPNGKASKLSAEQHRLVRTPAFKAWFGDWEEAYRTGNYDGVSKVLDENGEPMVCYHGSNNPKINRFDAEKAGSVKYSDWGKGIYFTPSTYTADYYSNEALKKIDYEYNRLYEVYEKTKEFSDLKKFQERGVELSRNEKTIVYDVFLNIKKPKVEIVDSMSFTDPFLSKNAKMDNKDGVFIKNSRGMFDEIIAFYPEQIKLADGTNTTFDSSNPDIRFAEGGKIPTTRKMVVIIKNIKNPNDTDAKGVANKYKGAYKRIYDILNEDAVFVEHTHEEEVMKGNDYFLFFDFVPDYNSIQQIKNMKNVEVIDENVNEFIANFNTTYAEGGETDYSDYKTAVVALQNEHGDFLILQRGSTAPWMPNKWSLVGGVVDAGEEPLDSAIREVKEEIGVDVPNLYFVMHQNTSDSGQLYFYKGKLPKGYKIELDYENQDFAWVNKHNYSSYDYVPHIKDFLELMTFVPEELPKFELGGIYHGSPHTFDKFSTNYMGSGEGAQAFGWGLYFTDLKGIAKNYAKVLGRRVDDEKLPSIIKDNEDAMELIEDYNVWPETEFTDFLDEKEGAFKRYLEKNERDLKGIETRISESENYHKEKVKDMQRFKIVLKTLRDSNNLDEITEGRINYVISEGEESEKFNRDDYRKQLIKEYENRRSSYEAVIEAINIIRGELPNIKQNRVVYKVTLHKGKTPDQYTWLDWDRPISDKALKIFKKFNKEHGIKLSEPSEPIPYSERMSGENLYGWLANKIGRKEASLYLLKNGIDGIKYPAESISKMKTSDSARGFNYVVFDDSAITIEEVQRFAEGGQTETLLAPNQKSNPVKEFLTWYKNWYKPISGKMNIMFSVPNELHLEELLAMMTEENVVVMELFEKTDQNIDAKPYMRQICEKADELGITIYLEPNPRYKYFAGNTEKRNKVSKEYLFDYYSNFGFEPTSDKRFMKRTPHTLFKKGGQINIDDYMLLTYHEKEGNWFVPKNEVYLWLYDDMDAGKKLQSGEYDYVLFPPPPPLRMAFKKNFVPPLLQIWTKKYQKEHKGSEKLMAVIRAWYDEKNHKLYLLMMTTRKDLQRKGIISSMIKELRKQFNVEQEDVIFDDPTEQGKSVMESKKFDKGGEVESITFYTRTYADGTTQRFSVEDYEKNVLPTLPKDGKFHLGGETEILLAPNGKPSNLTPKQWHLVRTPEFKNWFGDWENDPENASKVIDINGEPLVVYHGTPYEFYVFKKDKPTIGAYGQGFYLTNDKSFASNYAKGEDSKLLSCFLNVRKVFEIDNDNLPNGYEKYSDMANNKGKSRDFTIKLKSLSYDGVYAKNNYDENEFVVFESNQIKLADGRNTTFDPSNPDIRFDKGGSVDYKKLELERIAAKYKDFDFDLSPSPHKKVRLAPNGKPSKLNEVQYKAVRSANFINWFGDWQKAYKTGDYTNVSKCIDENGEPLIVYRGHSKKEASRYTKVFNYQVNRFALNRNPNRFAFYFTESYFVASQYGGGDDEGIVTPYFLNIREMCDFTPTNPEYPNKIEFSLPYFDKYDKIWIESLVKIKEGKVTLANFKDEIPEAVISFFEKMQGRVTERNFESFKNLIEKKANYKMAEIVDENKKYYSSHATLKQVIKMIDPNMPLSIMDTNDTHYSNFSDFFNKNFPVFFFFIHHISFLYWNVPENTDLILKNEMVKRGFTGGKFLETTYAENSPTGTEMVYFNFYPEDVKLADGSNYTFRPDVKDTDYGDGGMIMIYPD